MRASGLLQTTKSRANNKSDAAQSYTPPGWKAVWGDESTDKNLLRASAESTKMPYEKLAAMLPKAFEVYLKKNEHVVEAKYCQKHDCRSPLRANSRKGVCEKVCTKKKCRKNSPWWISAYYLKQGVVIAIA